MLEELRKIRYRFTNIPIYFLLLFLVNEKVLYEKLDKNNYIYYIGSLLIFFAAIVLYYKELVMDKYIVLIFLSQLWIIFCNVINTASYLSTIRVVNVISLTLVCIHGIRYDKINFLRILRNVLLVVCGVDQYITIYQVFVMKKGPEGGYGIFLHKNAHVIMYMAVIIIWWYINKYMYGKMSKILCGYIVFCVAVSVLVLRAGSSSVSIGVLVATIAFGDKISSKIYNVVSIILAECVFFYAIIVNRVYAKIISFILVNILKKDLSFSGRALMWDSALNKMKDLPIWGFGDDVNFLYVFQNRDLSNNCHNYILHIIMSGGWVYLFLVLLIFFVCHMRMKKYYHTNESKMILYYLTVNLIIGFTEIMVTMSNLIIPFLAMGIIVKEWCGNDDRNVTVIGQE